MDTQEGMPSRADRLTVLLVAAAVDVVIVLVWVVLATLPSLMVLFCIVNEKKKMCIVFILFRNYFLRNMLP